MAIELASSHIVANSDEGSAREHLAAWFNAQTGLAFVYFRSKGGLIGTGRAVISSVSESFLQLRSASANLLITIADANYSQEPQLFFAANFQRSFMVEGVSLQLANFDWLFLSSSAPPGELAFGKPQLSMER